MPDASGAASPALQRWLAAHHPLEPAGRKRLLTLLSLQHYRLAGWQWAADAINWRRFFEVSDLIGVRVEREDVFRAVHALPLRLYEEGLIDGLRIDHVDGLACPLAYCRRLRAALRERGRLRPSHLNSDLPWVVVEKILAPGEYLDERWEVSGTTGYDFMADVGAVMHHEAGESPLSKYWAALTGDGRQPAAWVHEARGELLDRHFVAERKALLRALMQAWPPSHAYPWTPEAWSRSLHALLRCFPVYRSYVEDGVRHAHDQVWFDHAGRQALTALGGDAESARMLQALDARLGGVPAPTAAAASALRRFQQLTPPLAAKSLEDTVFYRYGRLLSRNDVGSDPSVFALSVSGFHQNNLRRAQFAPWGLLATATHDHKRGEDVRARLALFSEIPDEWRDACNSWLKQAPRGADPGFGCILLQTLVGAWPPTLSAHDPQGMRHYLDRVAAWVVKALREGKRLSSWLAPDLAQEERWLDWLDDMMPGKDCHVISCSIEALVQRLEPGTIANGLIQSALRMTAPGIPDLYQGTEWRDFSLVDPDNRRPVDFWMREQALVSASSGDDAVYPPFTAEHWSAPAWSDGRVKQALIATLLELRRTCAKAFDGNYLSLQTEGRNDLLAYSRGGEVVLVAGVKCGARLGRADDGMPVLPDGYWSESVLEMPDRHPAWRDVLRGRILFADEGRLPLAGLLAGFPLAVLRRDQG